MVALQLWALTILGLVGSSAGLRPQKMDFFHSETKLNHLVMGEASGMVYLEAENAVYQLSTDWEVPREGQQPLQGHLCPVCLLGACLFFSLVVVLHSDKSCHYCLTPSYVCVPKIPFLRRCKNLFFSSNKTTKRKKEWQIK